jgi:hypothetical protein
MKHINYTVTDTSGKVLRHGVCQVQDYNKQAGDGEFVSEGTPLVKDEAPKRNPIDTINMELYALVPELMIAIANDDMKAVKDKIRKIIK